MKKIRVSVLVLVVFYLMLLFTGCGKPNDGKPSTTTDGNSSTGEKDDSESENSDSDSNLTNPGEFPIVKEPIELKVFYVPNPAVIDVETNYAVKWLEEKTNVKVDWMLASGEEAGQKLNLLLAANNKDEMPDVFYSGMSRAQAESYGSQGILMSLNDLIEEQAINFQLLFEHNDKLKQQMTAFDGNIYFLPRYYESVHVKHYQKMWMNHEWLKNVDKDVPTTTDEFYDVLKAFKEQDANGNGDPNDEIPYIVYNYSSQPLHYFVMNAFVYSPTGGTKLYLEDGIVTASYAQEGWREGMRFYKKLYDEGLLDKEVFSLTAEQAKALASDQKGNRVGAFAAHVISIFDQDDPEILNYETISPLKGPEGLQQSPLNFYNPAPFFTISSYCGNPEAAIRWADAQAVDIVAELEKDNYEWMNFWYGPEDDEKGWRKAEEGEVGFTEKPAKFEWLFNWGDNLNTHLYETFLINMKAPWKEMMVADIGEGYNQEAVLYNETVNKYIPYEVDKTLPNLSFDSEEAAEVAELGSTLGEYYEEMFAKFILGEVDLDVDWDSYLKELENIGLSRYLELYQTAYDRTYK